MPKYDVTISEEELKMRVGQDFFPQYDAASKLGKIDYTVSSAEEKDIPREKYTYFLWAESKKGTKEDIIKVLYN